MAFRPRKRPWPQLIVAASLCVAIAAQDPQPEAEPEPEPVGKVGRTSLDVHTEQTSRELFSACDRDSDDRLDLFEACDALENLGDPKDSRSFLALDRDRDGFLQWPEFDEHYRSSIQRGGTFRVRTCRRFVKQLPELQQAKTATPLDVFIQLNDTNENGGLDPEEIQKIVRDLGLLPVLETQLKRLDLDQSGLIEPAELAPWFEQIRSVVSLPGVSELPTPSGMPSPWGEIDSNGDSAIDIEELTQALRRLDPGLARWATVVMKKLDTDGDHKLTDRELPGAQPVESQPVESGPGQSGSAGSAGSGSGTSGSAESGSVEGGPSDTSTGAVPKAPGAAALLGILGRRNN